jgi:CheY-like chemotaxis protein
MTSRSTSQTGSPGCAVLDCQASSAIPAGVAEAPVAHAASMPRSLLLVDDEPNIVSSLKRLLRRDNYAIHTAGSGQEGLDILAAIPVDVIISDQRMPGMMGVDFLRQAKQLYPDTVRIVLSGYSELQSVVAAVNEGDIYKFLMKPWDDAQLREHIAEAFRRKGMEDENRRLTMKLTQVNGDLLASNRRLQEVLALQINRIEIDETSLDITREALDLIPVPVLALDDEDVIVYMNASAIAVLENGVALLGCSARDVLPRLLDAMAGLDPPSSTGRFDLGACQYRLVVRRMGGASHSRGRIVTLL